QIALGAALRRVTVDGTRGGENQRLHAAAAHGLEHVPRRDRALLEVEPRVVEAPARFGIGGQMKDHVVPGHGALEGRDIERIADHELALTSVERGGDELAATDGQIVEHRDRSALHEALHQVAADEARAADDEVAGHAGTTWADAWPRGR